LEVPGRVIEDIVAILPGEVTSPKEVESDLARGENRGSGSGGGTADEDRGPGGPLGREGGGCSGSKGSGNVGIYNTNGKGGGFGDGRHALSFIMVGT
jgi:hypothetical protein